MTPAPGDSGGRSSADDETQAMPLGGVAPEPRRIDQWAGPRPDARPYRSSFIGMAGLAMMLFLILASSSVLPWWVVGVLILVWVAALVRSSRWFMTRPRWVLATPAVVLVIWLVTLMGGAIAFGWG